MSNSRKDVYDLRFFTDKIDFVSTFFFSTRIELVFFEWVCLLQYFVFEYAGH